LGIVVALGEAMAATGAVGLQIAPPLIAQERLHLLVRQPRMEVAVDDVELGLLRAFPCPDFDVHRALLQSRWPDVTGSISCPVGPHKRLPGVTGAGTNKLAPEGNAMERQATKRQATQRGAIAGVMLALSALAFVPQAHAQTDDYPNRPIRWIIGFPPGS